MSRCGRAQVALVLAAAALAGCKSPGAAPCPAGVDGGECTPSQTCEATSPAAESCAAVHRVCVQLGETESCGACVAGYVAPQGQCRPVATCASLGCMAAGRTCVEADALHDAACGDCLPGTMNTASGCAPPSCDRDAPGSLLASCDQARRACVPDPGGGAHCGDCFPGLAEDANRLCTPLVTCANLNCVGANRLCEPQTERTDARCGACRGGFVETAGVCQAVPNATCDAAPAAGSILASCMAQHRSCAPSSGGAACGACLAGYVDDAATGKCLMYQDCATANCAALNRECSPSPTGHCTTCSAGFVEDSRNGMCRSVLTCSDIKCSISDGGVMEQCMPPVVDAVAGVSSDAVCHGACAAGTTLWNGRRCEPCPPCDKPSENGPETVPTSGGYCICKTKPGYFYLLGGDIGTFSCDADNDGWVRESARGAVTSVDPVLRQNARCNVRSVDRFQLFGESAPQPVTVRLPAPVPLYETDRNDDDKLLAGHWSVDGLASYTGNARKMTAAELNRLTKICHDPKNDYNDNGVPDVAEFGEQQLSLTLLAEQKTFNRFSYFIELDWGAYLVAPATTTTAAFTQGSTAVTGSGFSSSWIGQTLMNGTTVLGKVAWVTDAQSLVLTSPAGTTWSGTPTLAAFREGTYVIHERSRRTGPANRAWAAMPIDYGATRGSHWRDCTVKQDTRWNTPQDGADHIVGMELTGLRDLDGSLVVSGMNHHSQFKCMVIGDRDPLHPEVQPWDTLKSQGYVLDVCTGIDHVVNAGNASGTTIRCSPTYDPAATGGPVPQVGTVAWAAVPYLPYGLDYDQQRSVAVPKPAPAPTYVRGCINECETQLPVCEAQANVTMTTGNPEAASCVEDASNYGKFVRCSLVEICDGVDNDANGQADETFPGKGMPCDSGLPGRCQPGTWTCKDAGTPAAVKFCQQNLFPVSEVCNGVDDDCDGMLDESIAQVGQPCQVTDPTACDGGPCRGACVSGVYGCDVSHGTPFCTPGRPKPEDCVSDKDLNCNGIVYDATPGPCDGVFSQFSPDQDQDGYPLVNATPVCLCADKTKRPQGNDAANIPWTKYTVQEGSPNAQRPDHCDICTDRSIPGAATVNPGVSKVTTSFHTEPNCCGTFDWNSDGLAEQQYTRQGVADCHWSLSGCGEVRATGWVQPSPPACGVSAPYMPGACNWQGVSCTYAVSTVRQACR